MSSDFDRSLDALLKYSIFLNEKIQDIESVFFNEEIPYTYSFTLNQIQKNLSTAYRAIQKIQQLNFLLRSKSSDIEELSIDSFVSEISLFHIIGHYLQNQDLKEKFLEEFRNFEELECYTKLFDDFSDKKGEKFIEKVRKIEKSMKLYMKKSNKTLYEKNCSYGQLGNMAHKAARWIISQEETKEINKSKISEESESQIICETTGKDSREQEFSVEDKPKEHTSHFCKVFSTLDEAVFDVTSRSSLIIGGFGLVGTPEGLLRAIHRKNLTDLSISTCLAGTIESGIGMLIKDKMVKHAHISHIGSNVELERQYINGEIEVEFTTQGSLAEKYRAGAYGIHSFYTPSGRGTITEEGKIPTKFAFGGKSVEKYSVPKQFIVENGEKFFLEKAITGDFALVKAWKADTMGNLIFRRTAKNANMDIAGSCKITIAEVEEIVPAGSLDPDIIHVPGVLVQRIVKTDVDEKPIERLALHKDGGLQIPGTPEYIRKRVRIAKRAAKEIKTGMFINLGLGMPTLIPNFLPEGVQYVLHGENGVLGVGPYPKEGHQDPDLINASRETITLEPGASTFSSSTSFGIIRGNHLDLTVLGGMQVSSSADLANWLVPGFKVKGMGGAIDLVSSKAKCIVCMDHLAYGNAKILEKCALPLTGKGVVDMLITNYGVFEFRKDTGMTLVEIADDVTLDQVKENTPGPFTVDSNLKFMQQ